MIHKFLQYIYIFLFVGISTTLYAYDHTMVSSQVPSTLDEKMWSFGVEHRFQGKAFDQPLDTLFGTDSGANTGFSLRYSWTEKINVLVQRVGRNREYTLGGWYSFLDVLGGNASLGGYYVLSKPLTTYTGSFVGAASYQRSFSQFTPIITAVYDTEFNKPGALLGLEYAINDELSLISEFGVSHGGAGTGGGSYLAGLRFDTLGHRFMMFLHNNQNIGLRHMVSGSDKSDMFVGFKIQRLLEW